MVHLKLCDLVNYRELSSEQVKKLVISDESFGITHSGLRIMRISFRVKSLRGMKSRDLVDSMRRIRPSTTEATVTQLTEWTHKYGEG